MAFLFGAYPINPTLVSRVYDTIVRNGDFLFPFDFKFFARAFIVVPRGDHWAVLAVPGSVLRFQDEVTLRVRVSLATHPYLGFAEGDDEAASQWPAYWTIKYNNTLGLNTVRHGRRLFVIRKTETMSVAMVFMKIALRFAQSVCVDINPILSEVNIVERDQWDPFKHMAETATYAKRIGIGSVMEAAVQAAHPWTRAPANAYVDPSLLEMCWEIVNGMPMIYHNLGCSRSRAYRFYRCGNCQDRGCPVCSNPDARLPPPVLMPVSDSDLDIVVARASEEPGMGGTLALPLGC
jgi:hypothetical protein